MRKTIWMRGVVCLLLIAALCLSSACGATTGQPDDGTTGTTTQPQTKPSTEGGNVMKDPDIYYCAVGSVDQSAKTAKVLFDDGSIDTITWDGDAPTVGTVNAFRKTGDVYTVETVRTFPPNGASFSAWGNTYVSARQKRFVLNEIYYTTEETVFFVRYSDTEWRVYKGRDAICNDGGFTADTTGTKAYMYYEEQFGLDSCKVLRYMMVVGDYAAKGEWPAATPASTYFLDPEKTGWSSGDKDLS